MGYKRTKRPAEAMSALPPKADIERRDGHVRFVPKADKCAAAKKYLFDHLVDVGEQPGLGRSIPLRARLAGPHRAFNGAAPMARDDEDEGKHDDVWDCATSHALAYA